jgi:hypothetical protein
MAPRSSIRLIDSERGGRLVDSIVYGNLRIEILAEHGCRIQRTTLRAKPPAIHARPRSFTLGGPARLEGRSAEVAAARAINAGEAIEFHVACGFGKSTLLRHLAATAGDTASVVYLRVGGQRPPRPAGGDTNAAAPCTGAAPDK